MWPDDDARHERRGRGPSTHVGPTTVGPSCFSQVRLAALVAAAGNAEASVESPFRRAEASPRVLATLHTVRQPSQAHSWRFTRPPWPSITQRWPRMANRVEAGPRAGAAEPPTFYAVLPLAHLDVEALRECIVAVSSCLGLGPPQCSLRRRSPVAGTPRARGAAAPLPCRRSAFGLPSSPIPPSAAGDGDWLGAQLALLPPSAKSGVRCQHCRARPAHRLAPPEACELQALAASRHPPLPRDKPRQWPGRSLLAASAACPGGARSSWRRWSARRIRSARVCERRPHPRPLRLPLAAAAQVRISCGCPHC